MTSILKVVLKLLLALCFVAPCLAQSTTSVSENKQEEMNFAGFCRKSSLRPGPGSLAEQRLPALPTSALRRSRKARLHLLELDLAVTKEFSLSTSQRLVVRTEIFNVINRANFGIPVRFLEAPGFRQATNTVTPGVGIAVVVLALIVKYQRDHLFDDFRVW